MEQQIAETLQQAFGESALLQEHNIVYFPKSQLGVVVLPPDLKENTATLYFYITHPSWDRSIFEVSASLGSDKTQAMELAVQSFGGGILLDLIHLLEHNHPNETVQVETTFQNTTHKWHLYSGNGISLGSNTIAQPVHDFIDELEAEIRTHLGNQKMSYVKLYAMKGGKDQVGECRINNIRNEYFSRRIEEFLTTVEVEESFSSYKKFLFYFQDDSTYTPYPYNEQQYKELCKTAILEFDNTDYDDYTEALLRKIPDQNLVLEFHTLLPELATRETFPSLAGAESMVLDTQPPITIQMDQLMCYSWMVETLQSGTGNWVSQHNLEQMIRCSALYNVLNNILQQNPGFNVRAPGQIDVNLNTYLDLDTYKPR